MVNAYRKTITLFRRPWILVTLFACGFLIFLTTSSLPLPGILPSHPEHYTDAFREPKPRVRQSRHIDHVHEKLDRLTTHRPIFDPFMTRNQIVRYWHLREPKEGKYMFTTLTRQIASQLPDLLEAIVVFTYFLGPQHVSFSFLEGPSDDGTTIIMTDVLYPILIELGVPESQISIKTGEKQIDFSDKNRIEVLAGLRNKALSPLWENPHFNDTIAVVFLNDVYLKATDALELLHHHMSGDRVGMTTAMDWMEKEPEYFYDIWVARTIDTGDLFYPIETSWFTPSSDLFHDSPKTQEKWKNLQPFQVYSSWNGMAILSPTPFLPPRNVRFRRGRTGECAASECQLIASDYWSAGWGRIQVVPSVQLAYTREVAIQTDQKLHEQKAALGWVDGVPPKKLDKMVKFQSSPPSKIKCHPWPETFGLDANVWESHTWVEPF